jgi:two-component system OmpR family response regulator
VYVHRLRRKLQDSGLNIRNVRGLGYMLEAQDA